MRSADGVTIMVMIINILIIGAHVVWDAMVVDNNGSSIADALVVKLAARL